MLSGDLIRARGSRRSRSSRSRRGCRSGGLVFGHFANVLDQRLDFVVFGSSWFLTRHLAVTFANQVKQLVVGLRLQRLRIGEVGKVELHVLGKVGLSVSGGSVAQGTVYV